MRTLCEHPEAYIDPPCCNGLDCGCAGLDGLVCPAADCTGFVPGQIEEIIRRIDE